MKPHYRLHVKDGKWRASEIIEAGERLVTFSPFFNNGHFCYRMAWEDTPAEAVKVLQRMMLVYPLWAAA